MTRLLGNPGMARRSNISLAILIVIFCYGAWELWHAATVSGSTTDYLFGFLFVGGAVYGARTAINETKDLIIALDADPSSGEAVIELWRPFRKQQIETKLTELTDWRHWIQTASRGRQTHFLLVRAPSYEGMLRVELYPGIKIPDEVRRLAPEAIADYERAIGVDHEG